MIPFSHPEIGLTTTLAGFVRHKEAGEVPLWSRIRLLESPFEFLLVQDLESIHVIRAEIMVHRARKKDRKLPE
jgi:hypothetical protein